MMPPVRNQHFHTSLTKRHAKYHSTPRRHKLASNPLYRRKGRKRLEMTALMKRELCDADLSGVPLFIDHLFPDHVLPFQITQELLLRLTNNDNQPLYNQLTENWMYCPNLSQKTEERHMANWLNLVCTRLSQIDTSKMLVPKRIWSSHFATKPLGGSATKRKPDIVLVNNFTQNGWVWQDIHGLIEMTRLLSHQPSKKPSETKLSSCSKRSRTDTSC
jgi:hypothetical protein